MRFFAAASQLKKRGVLGMNARNARYILLYNKRKLYPLADDKIITKQLAQQAQLTVPDLYAVIDSVGQLGSLSQILSKFNDFVIKPASGSGGEGVYVIIDSGSAGYMRARGELVQLEDLKFHIANILHGLYSLGGQSDRAMIEYRVKFDKVFEAVSVRGVPDIRIVVFLGVPVLAMVRLPTQVSQGRANLHQGAIGAGIAIRSGTTSKGVQGSNVVSRHPDTGHSIEGIKIPGWENLLQLAARCYELTGLGYLGVDIVLDQERGPMILEINARPGLAVQIANQTGLRPRLELIEQQAESLDTVEDRVAFALQHFD